MPVTAAVVASVGQAGLGLHQTLRANRLRKKALSDFRNNPMTIPSAATQAVNMAGKQAQGTRLPEQDVMEENLRSGTAQSLNQARKSDTSPSQILASTIQSYNAQQQAQQNLDLQAAQNWQDRQSIYRNAVMSLAPYQQKIWETNVLAPIQMKMNQASIEGQSGMQNIGQGIQSGLSVMANQQMLNSLNTSPTGAQGTMSAMAPKTMNQLPIQQQTQGLMPMYNNPWWGDGYPNTTIQQRQGNY